MAAVTLPRTSTAPTAAFHRKCNHEWRKLRARLEQQLQQDIERIYTHSLYWDLELVFNSKTIRTHQSILQVRAARFFAEFCTSFIATPNNNGFQSISFQKCPVGFVEAFIRNLYTKNLILEEEENILQHLQKQLCTNGLQRHISNSIEKASSLDSIISPESVYLTPDCSPIDVCDPFYVAENGSDSVVKPTSENLYDVQQEIEVKVNSDASDIDASARNKTACKANSSSYSLVPVDEVYSRESPVHSRRSENRKHKFVSRKNKILEKELAEQDELLKCFQSIISKENKKHRKRNPKPSSLVPSSHNTKGQRPGCDSLHYKEASHKAKSNYNIRRESFKKTRPKLELTYSSGSTNINVTKARKRSSGLVKSDSFTFKNCRDSLYQDNVPTSCESTEIPRVGSKVSELTREDSKDTDNEFFESRSDFAEEKQNTNMDCVICCRSNKAHIRDNPSPAPSLSDEEFLDSPLSPDIMENHLDTKGVDSGTELTISYHGTGSDITTSPHGGEVSVSPLPGREHTVSETSGVDLTLSTEAVTEDFPDDDTGTKQKLTTLRPSNTPDEASDKEDGAFPIDDDTTTTSDDTRQEVYVDAVVSESVDERSTKPCDGEVISVSESSKQMGLDTNHERCDAGILEAMLISSDVTSGQVSTEEQFASYESHTVDKEEINLQNEEVAAVSVVEKDTGIECHEEDKTELGLGSLNIELAAEDKTVELSSDALVTQKDDKNEVIISQREPDVPVAHPGNFFIDAASLLDEDEIVTQFPASHDTNVKTQSTGGGCTEPAVREETETTLSNPTDEPLLITPSYSAFINQDVTVPSTENTQFMDNTEISEQHIGVCAVQSCSSENVQDQSVTLSDAKADKVSICRDSSEDSFSTVTLSGETPVAADISPPKENKFTNVKSNGDKHVSNGKEMIAEFFKEIKMTDFVTPAPLKNNEEEKDETDLHDCGEEGAGAFESSEQTCSELRREIYPSMVEEICNAEQDDTIEKPEKGEEEQLEKEHTPLSCDAYWAGERTEDAHEPTNFDEDTNRYTTVVPEGDTYTRFPPLLDDQADIRPLSRESELTNATTKETISETDSVKESTSSPEGSESHPPLIRRKTFELDPDDEQVAWLRQEYERRQGSLLFQSCIPQYSQHVTGSEGAYNGRSIEDSIGMNSAASQDTELSENMSDIMEVIVQDKPMEEKDKIQRFFNTQNIVQTTSVADKHPSVILPQSSLTSNVVLPVVEAEITQKNAHHFPLLEDDIHSPDSLNNDGPMEAFFPETVTVNETEDTIQSKYSMFTKKNWKPNMDTASPMDSFFNNNVTNEEKECDENGGIIEKQVNEYLEKECINQQNIQVSRSCHEQQDDAYKENFKRLSSSYDNSSRPVVSGALTCSDIIDPKVYESPKRQKRTESTPIVSGGVSTEDFVAPVIKARDSPQTRRRTESTPILSGANTLVIESEKPKYKGSPKCPRKWDATPVLSAWVVDMSDCGGKSPETRRRRRQSDCVPIISGGLQAVEFVEQPVESPGKVSERELADAKGKNSSLGFFVDLSDDVSTEDSSGSKAKCKQETTAQKRNMFSMFIDISDVKNESSKASCSDESVKERASPSTAAVQIPPRKPAGLSSDPIPCRTINTQSQRLTDVATDSDEPTPKVCEQSKGVFMFIDASVPPPEKQPAKEPQEKPQKEKQGFFMFIEADPPVVRRQTHSGSRPTVKRHSWNLDAQITEEQRKHKRAQSLCVDKNMLFLSEDGIVKSSSEERSTMKLKTDSTQSLHEGEGSPSSSFKGSPLIKDKSSSTKQLSSYAKLREKITRRCSSFDSKVSCCKLMETEQFTRTTEKFEDAPSAYDASETKREFSASDNSKLVKVTPKEQSDVSNEKDVDDSKEIEDGPVNEHGDAKCSMQHLPGKAVDDHLEVSKDEAVNNNEISGTETAQKIEDKEKEINIEKEAKPSQDVTKAEDTCTPHVLDSMMTKSTDSQVSNKDTDKMKSSDDGSSRTEGRPLVRSAVLSHGRSGKLLPHAAQSPLPGARSQSPSSLASSTVLTRGRSKSPTSQSQTSTSTSFPSCHSPSQDTDDVETQFSETSDMSSMQSSVERSGLEGSTEETDVSSSYPGKGPCSRLGEDLLRMFLDEINTDVNVEVAGRRIKAHKCILSSRCQYFAAMLSGGWVESAGNIISLQGFSYNAVHFALCHIYSGTSNIPDSINIVELATLADMLGLEGLKEVIMYTLKVKYCHFFHKPCTMCAVGVLECLPLAAAYGLDEIYRKSLKWITKYFVRIWPTKSFASLPRELIEKCYHQHIVHMTVENVLDTVMSCDKLLATLPNVRWAEPLFGLTSQLLEASIKFIADNFSAVLTSEKFVCLGKELSWNISRLEDSIMAATESLPAEQACQSHMRLHRILAVVKSEDPPPEMQWSTSFVELLQRIQDRVQSSLIRQAPKAARCKSWNQMDAELREKIQEAACLVLDSEDGQKSRHSSLMRRSGRPKSQTSSTLYCTTPRNAGRGYSSHAVSATVDMRQVKLAMAQRSKFQRVQSGGSSTRSSANKVDPIPVADCESVAKETPVQRRRTAPLASRSQKENQRPASMGQRFKKSSDAKSTEQAPRPKTWPMRMLEGKSSTPQKSSPAGTSSTSVSRTATPEKSAVPSRMKASSSDSSRTSSPAFHRVPRVARDIALYGSNTRPVTPTQIRKRETPKEKGSSLDLPQRTRSEQDASGKPKVSPGSSQIPVARTLSPEAKTAKLLASKELKPECESNDTQSPTARSDFVRARNSPSLGRTPGVGRFVSDRAPFSPLKDNRLKSSAVSSPTKPRIPSHTNSPMRKTAKPNEAASGGRAANKASVPDSSRKQAAKTDGKSAIVERAKLARSSSATVTKRATNSKNQSVVEKSRWPLSPKVTEPKNRNQVSPKGPRDGRNLKDSGRPSTPSEKGTRGGKQGAGKGRQHVANGMVSSGAVKTKNKQNNTSASSSSEKQEAKPPTVGSRSGTFLKDEPTILKKPEVENVQEQS